MASATNGPVDADGLVWQSDIDEAEATTAALMDMWDEAHADDAVNDDDE